MSPLAALFVAVVALYLIECVALVPEDALVLVEGRRGGWRIARRGFALGALRRRAVVLSLWPHRGALVLPAWPAAFTPDVLVFATETSSPTGSVPYSELLDLRADGAVVRWRTGMMNVQSPRRARRLVRILSKLRDAPEATRARAAEAAIDEIATTEQVQPRIEAYARAGRWPRVLGLTLWAHLFAIWPVTVGWLGVASAWRAVVLELVVLVALVCWSSARARRALCAEGGVVSSDDGFSLLTLALSPPAATRAVTQLSRDLIGDAHPLAVSLALCAQAEGAALAARAWRAARFGHRGDAGAADRWFSARWSVVLDRLIASTVGAERVATTPPREGESIGYCPLCWTQYSRLEGTCSDCTDVTLHAFSRGATADGIGA